MASLLTRAALATIKLASTALQQRALRLHTAASEICVARTAKALLPGGASPALFGHPLSAVPAAGVKTRSSVKKRISFKKSNGSLLRARSGKSHLNMNKGRNRVNKLGEWGQSDVVE